MKGRTLASHSALVALAALTAAVASSPTSNPASIASAPKQYRPPRQERMDTEGYVRRNKSDRKRNKRQRW